MALTTGANLSRSSARTPIGSWRSTRSSSRQRPATQRSTAGAFLTARVTAFRVDRDGLERTGVDEKC
jgi:hypothetical protein